MNSIASRLARVLRISYCLDQEISLALGVWRAPRRWYSAGRYDSENEMNDGDNNLGEEEAVPVEKGESDAGGDGCDEILGEKREMQLHGVDPRRGWGFRGVHKAIICGRIGQAPVQKMLRNGRTVTIFMVGTGGLFDLRIVGAKDLPKPAQWHRIAVHNEALGTYAVQQLVKNSSVYVEGDIETRLYNDSINGEVKSIPEISVRFDGRIRLIKSGESVAKLNFDDLRELRDISMISLHFNRVRGYFRHKLSRSANWLGTVQQPNMPWLSSRERCLDAYLPGITFWEQVILILSPRTR